MKLGLNLSFAVKRWMKPEQLAAICKKDFGVDCVQFTWDLIDPWWPEELRDKMVAEYKSAFEKEGGCLLMPLLADWRLILMRIFLLLQRNKERQRFCFLKERLI